MKLNTPILFIIFNQPKITKQVFSVIKSVKPKTLYIAADGPRINEPSDFKECKETREIVNEIDWDCNLATKFHESNIGCRKNVSTAITWFLNEVDEGIILEFDCLPNEDFFIFCEKMLEYYRNDLRILSIAGTNFQFGKKWGDGSYYFSRISTTWGWATWKRAWNKWEGDVKLLPNFIETDQISNYFFDKGVSKFWIDKFLDVYHKRNKTTWGFAWVFAHFIHNGFAVLPNENLVSNIGFNEKATHAKDPKSKFSNIKSKLLGEIKHPSFVIPCRKADEEFTKIMLSLSFINKIKLIIKFFIPKFIFVKIKKMYIK